MKIKAQTLAAVPPASDRPNCYRCGKKLRASAHLYEDGTPIYPHMTVDGGNRFFHLTCMNEAYREMRSKGVVMYSKLRGPLRSAK